MAVFALKTPDLGDTEKIELIRWLVSPGDSVSEGEELVELVTDKAAFPVESPYPGVLSEIVAPAGSVVQKGQILGYLERS